MRFRYKKLILFFSLGIMLIGMGTFSMLAPNISFKGSEKKENKEKVATFGAIQAVSGKSSSDIQQEIEELIKKYMDAKQRVAMDELAECVSDVENVEETKLLAESEYVEKYENIQCKVLDGAEEGTYRVYAYYDVKIYDIETRVPSLTALYLKMDDDNRLQIYLGALDSEEQKFIEELDASDSVNVLVDMVQKQLEYVLSTDQKVREFYDMLESVEDEDPAGSSGQE